MNAEFKAAKIRVDTIVISNINNIVVPGDTGDESGPSIQDEIDKKEPLIDLPPDRAVASNNNGKLIASTASSVELGYLKNARSNIQQQIDDSGIYERKINANSKVEADDDAVQMYTSTVAALTEWQALAEAGTDNQVSSMLVMGTDVYMCGEFTFGGSEYSPVMIKYDTVARQWIPLYTGDEPNASPVCMTSLGTDIYVGGYFTWVAGIYAPGIAKYDTVTGQWSALGSGIAGGAQRICAVGTDIFFCGNFTEMGNGVQAFHVARYDTLTGEYSALIGDPQEWVQCVASDGDELIVGGGFTSIGQTAANNIARYDPTNGYFQSLNNGVDNAVYEVAVSGNNIYVCGAFETAGWGTPAQRIARFNKNNGQWSALGSGIYNPAIALAVSGTNVYVTGVRSAGGVTINNVGKYTGSTGVWTSLDAGEWDAGCLATMGSDFLFVGGNFTDIHGGNNVLMYGPNYLTLHNQAETKLLHSFAQVDESVAVASKKLIAGDGLDVHGALRKPDFAPGRVVVTGTGRELTTSNITTQQLDGLPTVLHLSEIVQVDDNTNTTNVQNSLEVEGNTWLKGDLLIGEGGLPFSADVENVTINDNTVVTNPNDKSLQAYSLGAGLVPNILVPLPGGGITSTESGSLIYSMTTHGSDVFVCGTFTEIGGVSANHIARYDTTTDTWSSLGGGIGGLPAGGGVQHITLLGHEGHLYIVGDFSTVDGAPGKYFARYNLSSGVWQVLGDGMDAPTGSLCLIGDDMYVGGIFTTVDGGISTHHQIARYDPGSNTFHPLNGSGLTSGFAGMSGIMAMCNIGTDLYVAGAFETIDGITAQDIAKYDTVTETWAALTGGGVFSSEGSVVMSIHPVGSKIYVHGMYDSVGGGALTGKNFAVYDTAGVGGWTHMYTFEYPNLLSKMTSRGTTLYVCGTLQMVEGTVPVKNIAKLDTVTGVWSAIENADMNGPVEAMAFLDSTLYVGGYFGFVGEAQEANQIAKFLGSVDLLTEDSSGIIYQFADTTERTALVATQPMAFAKGAHIQGNPGRVVATGPNRELVTTNATLQHINALPAMMANVAKLGAAIEFDEATKSLYLGRDDTADNVYISNPVGTKAQNIYLGSALDNVFIQGATTIVESTTHSVSDPYVTVNVGGLTPAGAGILVESSGTNAASILVNEDGKWRFTEPDSTEIVLRDELDKKFDKTTGGTIAGNVGVGEDLIPLVPFHVAGTMRNDALTGNRVVTTDSNKNLVSSNLTVTELAQLVGTTSSVQTQLNSKFPMYDYTSFTDPGPAESLNIGMLRIGGTSDKRLGKICFNPGAAAMGHSDGVAFDIDIGTLPAGYDKDTLIRFFRATGSTAKRRVILYDGTTIDTQLGVGSVPTYFKTSEFGIGTDVPGARLHVIQAANDKPSFRVDDQTGDTSYFFVDHEGKVRVNTNISDAATETFLVSGTSRLRGDVFLNSDSTSLQTNLNSKLGTTGGTMTGPLTVQNDLSNLYFKAGTNDADDTNSVVFQNSGGAEMWRIGRRYDSGIDSTSRSRLVITTTSATPSASTKYTDHDVTAIAMKTNGNVGVGVANPQSNLHVAGTIRSDALTASTALVTDANKNLVSSSVSVTELARLVGVTSPIQTQLDGKLNTSGGTITNTLTLSGGGVRGKMVFENEPHSIYRDNDNNINMHNAGGNDSQGAFLYKSGSSGSQSEVFRVNRSGVVRSQALTANRALTTNANKDLVSSAATSTELGYLSGVTSNIQTQFDSIVNGTEYIDVTEDTNLVAIEDKDFQVYNYTGTDTKWFGLRSPINGTVAAFTTIGDTLYVGGSFSSAIVKYDTLTGTWSALGSGVSSNVSTLTSIGTDLYIGGSFTTAGGNAANRIAKYDTLTGTWSALGSGANGNVSTLTPIGTDLYVGGNFTTAGGNATSRIAKYNTLIGTWSALGSGTNLFVIVLTSIGTDLYVGGGFATAGGVSAPYIALWSKAVSLKTYDGSRDVYTLSESSGPLMVVNHPTTFTKNVQFDAIDVTSTDLAYLKGVTSPIQTQFNIRPTVFANGSISTNPIICVGHLTTPDGGSSTVNYQTGGAALPWGYITVTATAVAGGSDVGVMANVYDISPSNFKVRCINRSGTLVASMVYWQAIGR